MVDNPSNGYCLTKSEMRQNFEKSLPLLTPDFNAAEFDSFIGALTLNGVSSIGVMVNNVIDTGEELKGIARFSTYPNRDRISAKERVSKHWVDQSWLNYDDEIAIVLYFDTEEGEDYFTIAIARYGDDGYLNVTELGYDVSSPIGAALKHQYFARAKQRYQDSLSGA